MAPAYASRVRAASGSRRGVRLGARSHCSSLAVSHPSLTVFSFTLLMSRCFSHCSCGFRSATATASECQVEGTYATPPCSRPTMIPTTAHPIVTSPLGLQQTPQSICRGVPQVMHQYLTLAGLRGAPGGLRLLAATSIQRNTPHWATKAAQYCLTAPPASNGSAVG